MKLDILNSNNIKITLTKKELDAHNICIHSFLSTPTVAANSFINDIILNSNLMLHKKQSLNFIIKSIISLNYSTFIFFISITKSQIKNNYTKLYKFDNYNTFQDFYTYIYSLSKTYTFEIEKYKYKSYYLICIKQNNTNVKLLDIMQEFALSQDITQLEYLKIKETSLKI